MKKDIINELAGALVSIKKTDLALAFLENILTPDELDEIATRFQVAKLLNQGVPQREVAETLGISIGTVSRGSRELKYGADGFKQVLKNWQWQAIPSR